MKKLLIFVVAMCVSVFFLNTPVEGWNELDKARDSVEMGLYDNAFELLNGIIKKNPKNIEAHMLLGICYLATNNDSKADDRFRNVLKQDSGYGKRFATEYKQAAEIARDNNNLFRAERLFVKAIQHDPGLQMQAYDFFASLGNCANGYQAERFYDRALSHAQNQKQRHYIGDQFLKLAYKNPNRRDALKEKAASIVGQAKVDKIFPGPRIEVVFEKPYTDKDIGKGDNIEVYFDCQIMPGDTLEVMGKIQGKDDFDATEIYIWKGKNFDPQWDTTINGHFRTIIEKSSESQTIWIEKGKKIEAKVRVTREIIPAPNIALIGDKR